mgnify:CR=1 FL=1
MKAETNWKDELKNAIRSTKELQAFLPQNIQPIEDVLSYKTLLPPFFLNHLLKYPQDSPLWRQFIPSGIEEDLVMQKEGFFDPIGDLVKVKVPQLIHRYPNRVLYFPTSSCPVACRYCFRKNELEEKPKNLFGKDKEKIIYYLNKNTNIEEIIFSGGDPFVLDNNKIESELLFFAQFPHVKYIRFHTRFPVILPQRLDKDLLHLLQQFRDKTNIQLIFSLHINHEDEITPLLKEKIKPFTISFPWISQTVLLKNVNDKACALKNLYAQITLMNIRPYYLHHPDKVKGAMHFYLSREEGRRIYKELRQISSGWMVPHYIIDDANAKGKELAAVPE